MHIKTNIELNIVHMVILAICPIMFLASNSNEALCLMLMAIIAFFLSSLIASLFNKVLSRNIKIFVTAIVSSLVVTLLNYSLSNFNFLGLQPSDIYYFSALSSIVLSIDIIYIDTKAVDDKILSRIFLGMVLFAGIYMIYAILIEFLAYGSVFGSQLFKFNGVEFFSSVPFGFILLGLICAISECVYKYVSQKVYDKKMAYEKFVKKIRDEKVFQYDNLRRKRVLVNSIEVRHVDAEEVDVLKELSSANEALEKNDKLDPSERQSIIRKKPKKNKKLRVSHEAKVEKLFDRRAKEGDEND